MIRVWMDVWRRKTGWRDECSFSVSASLWPILSSISLSPSQTRDEERLMNNRGEDGWERDSSSFLQWKLNPRTKKDFCVLLMRRYVAWKRHSWMNQPGNDKLRTSEFVSSAAFCGEVKLLGGTLRVLVGCTSCLDLLAAQSSALIDRLEMPHAVQTQPDGEQTCRGSPFAQNNIRVFI